MSDELIKIVVVIIISAVFVTVLRNKMGEYSIVLTLAVVAIVLGMIMNNLFGAFGKISELFLKAGNTSQYFFVALKALGVSYVSAFAADLCRDFGLSALAQTSELAGKVAIFLLSLPLMTAVLETALKFVGL